MTHNEDMILLSHLSRMDAEHESRFRGYGEMLDDRTHTIRRRDLKQVSKYNDLDEEVQMLIAKAIIETDGYYYDEDGRRRRYNHLMSLMHKIKNSKIN